MAQFYRGLVHTKGLATGSRVCTEGFAWKKGWLGRRICVERLIPGEGREKDLHGREGGVVEGFALKDMEGRFRKRLSREDDLGG
jgi:hypothetical protein